MQRNYQKTCERMVICLLLMLALSFGCSNIVFGQMPDSEETPDVIVPERALEQVVRRVLVWSFKPRDKPTVVYLAEQEIKQSWLPTIKNIEFRILSAEEIEQKNIKVYFFTKPALTENIYDIGFAYGTLNCDYWGTGWYFRISKRKVRLWQSGTVGGACGSYA